MQSDCQSHHPFSIKFIQTSKKQKVPLLQNTILDYLLLVILQTGII